MAAALVVHVVPTAVARGAQVFARALADALDGPGHPHRLLCLFDGPDDVAVDEQLGCPGGARPGAGFRPGAVGRLRSRLRTLDPCLVVAHGGDALKYVVPALGLLPAARRPAGVYHAIGTMGDRARQGPRLRLWQALVARSDLVAAVSDDVADECRTLLRVPPGRLVVAPNGRDPAVFRPAAAADIERGGEVGLGAVPVVAFVGRLVAPKRPERFVRVVEALRGRGLAVRAVMIGDGPLRSSLAAPAAAAGVDMVGGVDDVAERLRQADVLVMPSLPAGEGMPGVLIEAGLSGVPVVASAVPGVAEIVEDGATGVVVPVGDTTAMVSAVRGLLADPERRAAMGAAARRRCVTRFSLDRVVAVWSEMLDALVRNG